jgi:thioredoxin-like negative regulator of GroEL
VNLTINEALKKAAEAYTSGNLQDADRLYTAILSVHPQNPDANHGLGILAVGIGKVEEALPFLKTALQVNPRNTQFCWSYVNALMNLNRKEEARAVFDEIKQIGMDKDDLNELNELLVSSSDYPQSASNKQPADTLNILDSIGLDRALRLAVQHVRIDEIEEASRIYEDILARFPRNKKGHSWA